MYIYSIGAFAKRIGKTVHTLQRWDREGRLVAGRLPSGHRYYTDAHLDTVRGITTASTRRTVGYCWVSSHAQKPDLANQQQALEPFAAARGLNGIEWSQEVGGGLNFTRPKFLALIDGCGWAQRG